MKILKEGTWNIPWTSKESCVTCNAELLVEESDVMPTTNRPGMFYFVCMICGKTNELSSAKIALRVREAVEKKRKYYSSSDW